MEIIEKKFTNRPPNWRENLEKEISERESKHQKDQAAYGMISESEISRIATDATGEIIQAMMGASTHKSAAILRSDIKCAVEHAISRFGGLRYEDTERRRRELFALTAHVPDDGTEVMPEIMGNVYGIDGKLLPHDGDRGEPEPEFVWDPDGAEPPSTAA
jgi:hypothetical protein